MEAEQPRFRLVDSREGGLIALRMVIADLLGDANFFRSLSYAFGLDSLDKEQTVPLRHPDEDPRDCMGVDSDPGQMGDAEHFFREFLGLETDD